MPVPEPAFPPTGAPRPLTGGGRCCQTSAETVSGLTAATAAITATTATTARTEA